MHDRVVYYSIVQCSHVRLRIYNEICRSMHSHVRIKRESVIMDVPKLRHDLAKVRHTHVRDNIHHLQASHMCIQHGKYYFLVS